MFLPLSCVSCKTSSACDGWSTCCSTKMSATCCAFISVHVSQRDRNHFVGRGDTGQNFAHTVFAQRAHAQLARALPQHQGRAPVVDHVPDVVVDDENLEDPHPAFVAGLPAFFAADRPHDLC